MSKAKCRRCGHPVLGGRSLVDKDLVRAWLKSRTCFVCTTISRDPAFMVASRRRPAKFKDRRLKREQNRLRREREEES